ncbi:unnamed protein product [Dibothriocephalus latus]|uniref:Uncharacterized protein n=1 Tax=Dibothriocephalus latus TaxID=60516 RepID=A0A3P7QXX1_DIBLA|nr:unnamed protein product [Dibothriocephalus latus]
MEYALKNPLVYDAPSSSLDGVTSGNRTRFLFNLTASAHDLSAYGRPIESHLKIQGLRTKEFGTYACRMRNIRGVAEGYIRLKRRGITELIPPAIYKFIESQFTVVYPMLETEGDGYFSPSTTLKLPETCATFSNG